MMASNLEVVSMIYDIILDSNSDHVQFFGSVIGHLEAELEFF